MTCPLEAPDSPTQLHISDEQWTGLVFSVIFLEARPFHRLIFTGVKGGVIVLIGSFIERLLIFMSAKVTKEK